MKAINRHDGLVALLNRNDVDTDAILPKQFMKSVSRHGYGCHVFDEWRYSDVGRLGIDCTKRPINSQFELNQLRYQGASILLSRRNFGCGSSREHAVWGLAEYGFRVIIAESFADIFRTNCANNGLLTVALTYEEVELLAAAVESSPGYHVSVRLEDQCVVLPDKTNFRFDIDKLTKSRLISGLDSIGTTLASAAKIKAFERAQKSRTPWLYK